MARCALIWLAFSKRSLKITEVAEAAIINPEVNTAFNPKTKFFNPSKILGILGSLVTYNLILLKNNAISTEDKPLYIEDGSTKEDPPFILKMVPYQRKKIPLALKMIFFRQKMALAK